MHNADHPERGGARCLSKAQTNKSERRDTETRSSRERHRRPTVQSARRNDNIDGMAEMSLERRARRKGSPESRGTDQNAGTDSENDHLVLVGKLVVVNKIEGGCIDRWQLAAEGEHHLLYERQPLRPRWRVQAIAPGNASGKELIIDPAAPPTSNALHG